MLVVWGWVVEGSQRVKVTRLQRRVVRIVRLKAPSLGARSVGTMRPGMLCFRLAWVVGLGKGGKEERLTQLRSVSESDTATAQAINPSTAPAAPRN